MTDAIIETMARAMCAADGFDWDAQTHFSTSASGNDDEQESYRNAAQAALSALIEGGYVVVEAENRKELVCDADR